MKKKLYLLSLFLTACSAADISTMRTPSLSGDPAKMSADTLCYRATYANDNPALREEIRARNLDCESILAAQPQPGGERF